MNKIVTIYEIKKDLKKNWNCDLIKDKKTGKSVKAHYIKPQYYLINLHTKKISENSLELSFIGKWMYGADTIVIDFRKQKKRGDSNEQ